MLRLKDGFYAKDECNDVYWFENKPRLDKVSWLINVGFFNLIKELIIDEDWQDSLYEIKNGIITKVIIYEKDQKVLVRDYDSHKWKLRYYSHYEDGKHKVFNAGGTSWSETKTLYFYQIKPYIEGQDEM